MNEITPYALRQQIAHLQRCLTGIAFEMRITNNTEKYSLLWAEYRRVAALINRLRDEHTELVILQNEQAQAVAEVERILEIGG